MRRVRAQRLLFLSFLLIPSAAYLWRNRDVPEFCRFHDDCVYFVSAKSLADGGGYRIESLPGQPAQTKYPPVYPALLSLAWRLNPTFPENLVPAAWISWLALPALLLLLALYAPRMGLSGWRATLVLSVFAANSYTIWFGSQLLSELLYLGLMFAAMLLIERCAEPESGAWFGIAAGAVAGLAYLARTAGIVLLPAAIFYLWHICGQRRRAVLFGAAMLPFIAGWTLWTSLHATRTGDPALLYYVNYLGYQLYNFKLADAHLFLWKNADGLLSGLGYWVLPKVATSLPLKIAAEVVAAAMIAGIVRIARRGQARLYVIVALANMPLLLLWHFPPDERLVIPLVPLALAGFLVEMEHLAGMLCASFRSVDLSQRMAAAGMALTAAMLLITAVLLHLYVYRVILPESAEQRRELRSAHGKAFEWIARNVPAGNPVLAYTDPMVYLYTGRPSIRRMLLPLLWYREDEAGIVDQWGNLAAFARDHGIGYFYSVEDDLSSFVTDQERVAIQKVLATSQDLIPVYRQDDVTIYKFRGSQTIQSSLR
jgi:hypothetical protein